ncbi:hypothetical protein [Hippea jasoniae]|uniref:hypothetical protein n=1 Tax=Hippea jasoniae TaxID=944479 RepID=UPI00054F8F83|nr:hypothetical protein [Hippea jasoniae]
MLKGFLNNLKYFWEGFKDQSTSALEMELSELENTFGLVVFGSLMGLPSPPTFVGMALLPYLEYEIKLMIIKSEDLDDKLATFFDLSDI